MQINNPPVKLVLPFGENDPSGRATIPVTTASPGYASLNNGFPAITRTPKAAGGIPPRGVDMNGILYAISAATRWASAGAGYKYDAEFANDANVAGYPKGARVLNDAGTGYYMNLVDGNTTNPNTGGTGWAQDWISSVNAASGRLVIPTDVSGSKVNIIVQWGTINSGSPGNFLFPLAFPNQALFIVAGNSNAQGSGVDNTYAYIVNNSTFFLGAKNETGNTNFYPSAWLAIGF